MKISLIEPVGGHGGMNYYDYGLASGLEVAGYKVNWYTCNSTTENSENAIQIYKFFVNIYSKNLPSPIRGIFYFCGLLLSLVHSKISGCQLVHLHFFHYTKLEWLTVKFVRIFGFKYVVTVHDVQSFIGGDKSLYGEYILSNASSLIVHNNYSLESLKSKAFNLSIQLPNVFVIPHGNYLPFIHKKDKELSRGKLSLPKNKKVLLFFGQIKKVKGLDVLLKALVKLERDDFVLLIAGKVWKDDWEGYQDYINKHNLNNKVISHIRYIADDEVDDYFSSADFVILPYRETFQSGVLLMAMSYSVVPVVSNIKGMTDIVVNEKNGFVFEPESEKSLADTLGKVLDIGDLSSYQNTISHEIQNKFDWNAIGLLTVNVYKNAM